MDYQKLFNYMSDEYDVILLETDMQEICNIVNEMQENELRQPLVSSSVCPDCLNGRDEFEPDWLCPECRKQTDR